MLQAVVANRLREALEIRLLTQVVPLTSQVNSSVNGMFPPTCAAVWEGIVYTYTLGRRDRSAPVNCSIKMLGNVWPTNSNPILKWQWEANGYKNFMALLW